MPKYVYYCESCEECFDFVHSMTEKHSLCNLCGEDGFTYRIPQRPSIQKPRDSGHLVDEFIGKNKQALEEMIKETKGKTHEP